MVMMATVKDVARLAGVSPITASRALNNPVLVHPDTIAKVKAAAKQLGYQPSRVAQGLRTGQTRIVMLSVTQKDTYDPLLFEFATGVSEACRENGYSLLIYPTYGIEELEGFSGKVDGVILTDLKDHDVRAERLSAELTIGAFGQTQYDVPQIDVDNVLGGQLGTRHLLMLGYRDIAFITSSTDLLFLQHREQGYVHCMKEAGLKPTIAYNTFDMQGGYAAMTSLEHIPEAVFCASDSMAVGVLRYLHERNLRIPVVGYDGGYLTEMTEPPLTSVKQPFFTVGKRLAEAMFEYMSSGNIVRELVGPELVVKDSTWPRLERLQRNS
jgi:LacI family transcriptional regulator